MLTNASSKTKLSLQPSTDHIIAEQRRQLFASVLVREFIRELLFLWDVVNGRATARDTFIKQVSNQLKTILEIAPGGDKIWKTISLVVKGVATVAPLVEEKLKEGGKSSVADLVDQSNLQQFEIFMAGVAREAVRRYEHFIVNKIKDEAGVTEFAKVGAGRMLEYLSRKGASSKGISCDENILLTGLIEGRSGGYVEGWRNHQLVLMNGEKVSAETVYARPGFRIFELRQGKPIEQFYMLDEKDRDTKGLGKIESRFRFGFTKFREGSREPKAGYIVVPAAVQQRYGYKLLAERKFEDKKPESNGYSATRVVVDKETIKQFLDWANKSPKNNSLREYVRDVLNNPKIELVICHEDLRDLSLAKKDLSFCDFSGSKFSGDLTATKFNSSYLVGGVFDQVTSARETEFKDAHCEFLQAENVDFSNGDFTLGHFDFAKLNKSKLETQKTLGSSWSHAGLDQVKAGQWIDELQKTVQQEQARYWEVLGELHKDIRERTQELHDHHAQCLSAINTEFEHNKNLFKELQRGLQNLVDQQIARIIFEDYCKHEIQSLKTQITKKADKQELEKLQLTLKALQKDFDKLKNNKSLMEELQKFKETTLKHTTKLNERLDQLEKTFSSINPALEQLSNQFKVLDQELTAKIDQLTKRVDTLEQKAVSQELKVEVLEQKSVSQQKILEDLVRVHAKTLDEQKQLSPEELEKLTPLLTRALKAKYSAFSHFEVPLSRRKLPLANIQFSLTTRRNVQSDLKLEQQANTSETKDQKKMLPKEQSKVKDEQKHEQLTQTPVALEAIFDAEQQVQTAAMSETISETDQPSASTKKLSLEGPRNILLTADAGFGKTTLSRYIALRWSDAVKEDKLQTQNPLWGNRFDFVFLIPLRTLRRYLNQSMGLSEILFAVCCDGDKENRKLLAAIIDYVIKNKAQRCLFILEGADEIAALLPDTDDDAQLEETQLKLKSLLKAALPATSCVLVTSRPYQVHKVEQLLPNKKFDRRLENRGFNNQQIEHAIEQYFAEIKSGTEQIESLKKYLKANPHIQSLAQVPLHSALMNTIWEDEQGRGLSEQMNMTALYQKITAKFLANHLKKNKAVTNYSDEGYFQDSLCKNEVQFLQLLAFETLCKGKTQFSHKEMDAAYRKFGEINPAVKPIIINTAYELGFLTSLDTEAKEEINKQNEFIHLTFQEFLAARYLRESLHCPKNSERFQEAVKFIQSNKYERRYSRLLEFTAGLVSQEPDNDIPLKHFWNSLLAPPLDLTVLGHWGIVVRCLEESVRDSKIVPLLSDVLREFNELLLKLLNSKIKGDLLIECVENHWQLARCPTVCSTIDLKQLWLDLGGIVHFYTDYAESRARIIGLLAKTNKTTNTNSLIAELNKELQSQKSYRLYTAVYIIGELGDVIINNLHLVQHLLEIFNNNQLSCQYVRSTALVKLGDRIASKDLVLALLNYLKQPGSYSAYVLPVLGKMGKLAINNDVIYEVLRFSKKLKARYDTKEIVEPIVELGQYDPAKVLQLLISYLNDYPNENLGTKESWTSKIHDVFCIVEVFSLLGNKALIEQVASALLQLISYEIIKRDIIEALTKLGNEDHSGKVLPVLIEALNRSDAGIRLSIIKILANLNNKTHLDLVSALLERIDDKDCAVKCLATRVLSDLGQIAVTKEVISHLFKKLADLPALRGSQFLLPIEDMQTPEEIEFTKSVIYTLGKLGRFIMTKEVINCLVKIANQANGALYLSALLKAFGDLGEIAADNKHVIRLLKKGLMDGHISAVGALVSLGKKAACSDIENALLHCCLLSVNRSLQIEAATVLFELFDDVARKIPFAFTPIIEVLMKILLNEGSYSEKVKIVRTLIRHKDKNELADKLLLAQKQLGLDLLSGSNARDFVDLMIEVLGKNAISETYLKPILEPLNPKSSSVLNIINDRVERANYIRFPILATLNVGEPEAVLLMMLKMLGVYIHDDLVKKMLDKLDFPLPVLMNAYLQKGHPYLPTLIAKNMFREVVSFTVQPDTSSPKMKDKNIVTFYLHGEAQQFVLTNKQVKKIVQEIKKVLKELNLPTTYCDHYLSGKPVFELAEVSDASTAIVKLKHPAPESKDVVHPNPLAATSALSTIVSGTAGNAGTSLSAPLQSSANLVGASLPSNLPNPQV